MDAAGRGAGRQPVRHYLRRPRGPDAQYHLGKVLLCEALDSQQGIGGGDGRRTRLAGDASSGPWVGQHRPAEDGGEEADRFGAPGTGAGNDHTLGRGPRDPDQSVERSWLESPANALDPVPRPAVAAPRLRLTGKCAQRLSKRKVCVHRTRAHRAGRRLGDETARDRSPTRSGRVVGDAGVNCPSKRAGEQAYLLDGLRRPDVMELRRAVCSAHDERDTGQMGLHDCRMHFHRRCSTSGHEHRRPTGCEPYANGEEGG